MEREIWEEGWRDVKKFNVTPYVQFVGLGQKFLDDVMKLAKSRMMQKFVDIRSLIQLTFPQKLITVVSFKSKCGREDCYNHLPEPVSDKRFPGISPYKFSLAIALKGEISSIYIDGETEVDGVKEALAVLLYLLSFPIASNFQSILLEGCKGAAFLLSLGGRNVDVWRLQIIQKVIKTCTCGHKSIAETKRLDFDK